MGKKIKSLFDAKLWRFLLVGILNTLVGNGLMFLLYNLTGLGYWLSTSISYALASILSYFLNRFFTFRYHEKGIRPILRFAANIAVCYLLAYGFAKPLVRVLLSDASQSLRDNIAMLFGMCLFTGFNYLGQRLYVFRSRPPRALRPKQTLAQRLCGDQPVQNLLLAFLLPFLIMFIVFAANGIFPFGDKQVLAHDMWHQYYPFFVDFRRKLLNGNSLLYSWTSGMGSNYLAIYGYYLASPLYLLSVLVPESCLREFFTLLLLLKISCSGLFFAVFLKTVFRRTDLSIVLFSLLYALCSFIMGYYWNIMWLDTVALLPLVVAGTISLLRDRHWRMYVLCLALAIWCNYYISFFICIFVALVFLGYTICYWDGFKGFFRRFLSILGCSLLGAGLTAVLVIPVYLALQNTASAINQFPHGLSLNITTDKSLIGILDAFRQVMSNQLVGTAPTSMVGLPNIYCGIISVFFAVLFCLNRKIRLRERIFSCLLLLFFAASFIFRQLDYIWHGFHFTNMLPYRFSFLYSFVILTMAYRAYSRMEDVRVWKAIVAFLVLAGIAACGYVGGLDYRKIIATMVLAAVLLTMVLLHRYSKLSRPLLAFGFAMICVLEGSICAVRGVSTTGISTRSVYPQDAEDTASVLTQLSELEKDSAGLTRTEVTTYQCLNDSALLGYNGIGIFSSTTNYAVSLFTKQLGLASWPGSNRYAYIESTPFTNLLLNLKYLVSRGSQALDTDYSTVAAWSGNVVATENTAWLPMGFVMKREILTHDMSSNDVNEVFSLSTGISEPLYEALTPSNLNCAEGCSLSLDSGTTARYHYSVAEDVSGSNMTFLYTMEAHTVLCLDFRSNDIEDITVTRNGLEVCSRYVKVPCLLDVGVYEPGDTVEVSFHVDAGKDGACRMQAYRFNEDVFKRGRAVLAKSVMTATKTTDTSICGTIDVKEAGVFYTSIPYESGWTARVDGQEVTITPVGNAFVAFPISEGSHTIEITYRTPGLALGGAISAVCLALLILMLILTARANRRKKEAAEAAAECAAKEAAAEADEGSAEEAEAQDGAPQETVDSILAEYHAENDAAPEPAAEQDGIPVQPEHTPDAPEDGAAGPDAE